MLERIRHKADQLSLRYRLGTLDARRAGLGQLIRHVKEHNLTYLSYERLLNIGRIVLQTEREGIRGEFLEAGCGLGGSSIVIARAKGRDRRFAVYDVFGQIPAPSDADGTDAHARYQSISGGTSAGIGGDTYYGYVDDLLKKVQDSFALCGLEPGAHNVAFVKGLYQDTMTSKTPVAFAHIDCDWYDSVRTCLENIVPRLEVGGSIIVDDYLDWSGCRKAVDEYFDAGGRDRFEFRLSSNLHVRKRANLN